MSEALEKIGGPERPHFDVGHLAAVFGLASAVIVFLAAVSSWAFARGFIGSIGFPAQIVTLRSSLDYFSPMAFEYVWVFVFALIFGFVLPPTPKRAEHLNLWIGVMLLLLALNLLGSVWETRSILYRGPMLFASIAAPFLVGYAYRSLRAYGLQRYVIVGFVCFLAFGTHADHLYQYGLDTGLSISTHFVPEHPGSELGMAAVKSSDFPLIALRTKEELQIASKGSKDGDLFTYQSLGPSSFLRLILLDENNYYVIENHQGVVRPIAIRREIVTQITFLNPSLGTAAKPQ